MTADELDCSGNMAISQERSPSTATPTLDDACDGNTDIQSSSAEDSRCESPSTLLVESPKSPGTKRKLADIDSQSSKRPCTTPLETWKGRLLGVEDDLFDAVWSLHEDDPGPDGGLADSDALLAETITYELEHVQPPELILVEDGCRSQRGDDGEDLERQVTSGVGESEDADLSTIMRYDLPPASAATVFEWLDPLTYTADGASSSEICSSITLPLIEAGYHLDIARWPGPKKMTSDKPYTSKTQLIHLGIGPIGSWSQIAGNTFGVMDIPLLQI
jgi:hypothetical protein